MPETEAPVLRKRNGRWVEIILNRPDKSNAFNDGMSKLLHTHLKEAMDDASCRAVLLTGSGRRFCAGQDLSDRDPRKLSAPLDLSQSLMERYNPIVRLIRDMPKPVICAVNGVAAGAGVGISLACDIVLAAESATFAFAFSQVGLIPDAGTSWHLARVLGEARAKYLLMTGGKLTAAEAANSGLISAVVADDKLHDESRELAHKLSSGAATALLLTKEAIRSAASNSFDEQLDVEMRLQGITGRTRDFSEGVLAFLERRPAQFTGK